MNKLVSEITIQLPKAVADFSGDDIRASVAFSRSSGSGCVDHSAGRFFLSPRRQPVTAAFELKEHNMLLLTKP